MRAVTVLLAGMMMMPSYGVLGKGQSEERGLLGQRAHSRAVTERLLGHVPQTAVDKEAYLYQRMSPEERKLHDSNLAELVKRAAMGMISYDDVSRFSKQDVGSDPGVSSDAVIQSRIDRFVLFVVGEHEKKRMNWPSR
jgi:hypothetical protein